MLRSRIVAAFVTLVLVTAVTAAPPIPMLSAHGTVDKVDKDALTIRPRGPDGKFAKSITLKLTGTSKVSTLSTQMRAGKPVFVQKETEPKDLQTGQAIAVIYADAKEGPVLLTAVVQPAAEK